MTAVNERDAIALVSCAGTFKWFAHLLMQIEVLGNASLGATQ